MPEYTKDEALAFINGLRLSLSGRVGFKWLAGKLSDLAAYIESITAENERLNAYLDWANARDEYASFCARYSDVTSRGGAQEEG